MKTFTFYYILDDHMDSDRDSSRSRGAAGRRSLDGRESLDRKIIREKRDKSKEDRRKIRKRKEYGFHNYNYVKVFLFL